MEKGIIEECTAILFLARWGTLKGGGKHYEILTLKITLKILEWLWKSMKLPKTKELSNPEKFSEIF